MTIDVTLKGTLNAISILVAGISEPEDNKLCTKGQGPEFPSQTDIYLHLLHYNLSHTMDYEPASFRLFPNITIADNHSFVNDVMDNPTSSLPWVLLIKKSVPPYLPYLLLGPAFQLLASLLLLPYTPAAVLSSKSRIIKWRTTFIARLSAAITGSWAVMSLYESPSMYQDLMFSSSLSGQHLVIFSLGVHLSEAVDMLLHCKPSMLLLHHLLVIICFAGALITNMAIGFAVLSLVTELNAVFNKTRILHIITETQQSSVEFSRNAKLNIVTFFIRILIIGWMNNQCFLYLGVLPLSFLIPCTVGLGIVNIWNLSVFKTLLQKDFFRKHKNN